MPQSNIQQVVQPPVPLPSPSTQLHRSALSLRRLSVLNLNRRRPSAEKLLQHDWVANAQVASLRTVMSRMTRLES